MTEPFTPSFGILYAKSCFMKLEIEIPAGIKVKVVGDEMPGFSVYEIDPWSQYVIF